MAGAWQTGLFGCFDDIGVCCFGYCCAPCQYGATSEIMGVGSCCVQTMLVAFCPACVMCCIAPGRRSALRAGLGGLPEEPCGDCVAWVCCSACANCQEARELKMRRIEGPAEYKSAIQTSAPGAA